MAWLNDLQQHDWFLIGVIVTNFITSMLYGFDKWLAIRGYFRIREVTLHVFSVFGWPGALIAQRLFRHKIKKLSFQLVFWGIGVVEVAILILWQAGYFSAWLKHGLN